MKSLNLFGMAVAFVGIGTCAFAEVKLGTPMLSVAGALAVPYEPENRFTVNGAIPVVSQLYKEDYNTLHSGAAKEYDLVTLGDSITCNWSVRDKEGFYALSPKGYPDGVLNLGIGGDRTEHLLWRLTEGGCLDGFKTKYFTLLIGTNNSFQKDPCDNPADIAKAIRKILDLVIAKHPESKILLMPILPYDMKGNQVGPVRHANNEKVNDIIIKYVDNSRVFWLDVRSALLNADGSFNDEYWSGDAKAQVSDGIGHYLHPSGVAYREVINPAVKAAMAKYAAVPAGTPQASDPSIGYAKPAIDGVKATATIALSGIYLGADAKGNAAKKYAIAYQLDGGKWVDSLKDQTVTCNSLVIPNVCAGKHACIVKITTDQGKSATKAFEFSMCDPWEAKPLTADAASVRTDGELVYAYAQRECTANGVKFARLPGKESTDLDWKVMFDSMCPVAKEVTDKGYSTLLACGWWFPNQTGGCKCPVTLKKLTPGAKYLVQIFAHRTVGNDGKIFIVGTQKETTSVKAGGEGWPFGGTLIGTITADADGTKSFVITADGGWAINALQVRKLVK